ncbi:hypothetical protein JCM8097_004269 [Rhodosporidiobolus ruineniae]
MPTPPTPSPTRRRSSRISQLVVPPTSTTTKRIANGRKRATVAATASHEVDSSIEEDGEEATTSSGSKKRKAPSTILTSGSSTKKAAVAAELDDPSTSSSEPLTRPRAPFSLFPSHDAFTLPAPIAPLPSPKVAPRALFIFGSDASAGVLGLGTDLPAGQDEIKRPRRHQFFEEKIRSSEEGWSRGVADVACGGMHTLVVDGEGRIRSWGTNDHGTLGRATDKLDADKDDLESRPGLVEYLDTPAAPLDATIVSGGDSVSVALGRNGKLKAWGAFKSIPGDLMFYGNNKEQLVPTAFRVLDNCAFSQVECGDNHVLALTSTGTVFSWGMDEMKQLGRGDNQVSTTRSLRPEPVTLLKDIVLIGAGMMHSFAVDKDGEVYSWGLNFFRQTGIAEIDGGSGDMISMPTRVAALSPTRHNGARVVQIVAGYHHSLFLLSTGKVYVCGRCDDCQLGIAGPRSSDCIAQPTLLAFPKEPKHNELVRETVKTVDDLNDSLETEETSIVQLACDSKHSLAVSSRGYVYCWGAGPSFQLGQGNVKALETPTRIWNTALKNVRVLRAETGGQHSVLIGIDRDAPGGEVATVAGERV